MSDLTALEARLAAVEAVLEIQALKARYAELVDARFAGGSLVSEEELGRVVGAISELFTPDAVWDGGPTLGTARGRTSIATRLRQPTVRFARHLFTSPRIEVDGDRATGRWELLAPMTMADGTPAWMSGVEHDTYRRHEGRWLHASMALTTTFVAPVSRGWERILA